MHPYDYYIHTDNSLDCQRPLIAMCEQALRLGVQKTAFTDRL